MHNRRRLPSTVLFTAPRSDPPPRSCANPRRRASSRALGSAAKARPRDRARGARGHRLIAARTETRVLPPGLAFSWKRRVGILIWIPADWRIAKLVETLAIRPSPRMGLPRNSKSAGNANALAGKLGSTASGHRSNGDARAEGKARQAAPVDRRNPRSRPLSRHRDEPGTGERIRDAGYQAMSRHRWADRRNKRRGHRILRSAADRSR